MMRIVLDTNVTISAILNPHGRPPGEILDQVFDQKVSLCLSPPLIAEIRRVIRSPGIVKSIKKCGRTVEQVKNIVDQVIAIAEITSGQMTIDPTSVDPDDDRVLECAIEAKADYIISGDKRHLLVLDNFQGVPILTPRAFLDMLINP